MATRISRPSRETPGAMVTPLIVPPNFNARIGRQSPAAQGLAFKTGATDFFGPSRPIPPAADRAARGRALDYPAGYNLQIRPRPYEAVSFADLRSLADAHDLTRLAIETRKDQMSKLDWQISNRETGETDDSGDTTAQEIRKFLSRPDREHSFADWQRMLVEDLLVIDAPTIYVWPTMGGQTYALELIAGDTIKRVIDDTGRTPLPPEPAYQQILKGIPAVNYTSEELIYRPRNLRTNRLYGFSPVEQILVIVNIALRRQVAQLGYYTDGNLPDSLAGVPSTWTTEQIETFQEYWDSIMGADDQAVKRRVRFVPGDLKVEVMKKESLFDQFDEWIARVVMFCFSLPVLPFVRQQNRATAETAQQTAKEEGLAPLMKWEKDLLDELIQGPLGYPGYEFNWGDITDVDPLKQAQIDHIYVTDRIKTRNEIRDDLGYSAVDGGDQFDTVAPPRPFGNPADQAGDRGVPGAAPGTGASPSAGEKLSKAAQDRLSRTDRRARSLEPAFVKAATAQFEYDTAYWQQRLGSVMKADDVPDETDIQHLRDVLDELVLALDFAYRLGGTLYDAWLSRLEPIVEQAVVDAAEEAAQDFGEAAVDASDPALLEVARQRTAALVQNITETTRNAIRQAVEDGVDAGLGTRQIAANIVAATSGEVAKQRAILIARTETIGAVNAGQYEAARHSGVARTATWLTVRDARVRPTHAAQEGMVRPLGEPFPNGCLYPGDPAGGASEVCNCRCTLAYGEAA